MGYLLEEGRVPTCCRCCAKQAATFDRSSDTYGKPSHDCASCRPVAAPPVPSSSTQLHTPLVPYPSVPTPLQAYILFRAKLAAPFTFQPGPESLETRLFAPTDIPFDDLAFSSVATSLK